MRKRWLNEYLRALQERNNAKSEVKSKAAVSKGSIVLIKDPTKHRANWRIGRIVAEIIGTDGVTRGYKIRTGNGYVVKRSLQVVCNLEIGGSESADQELEESADAIAEPENVYQHGTDRVRRGACSTAMNRLVGAIANENEED